MRSGVCVAGGQGRGGSIMTSALLQLSQRHESKGGAVASREGGREAMLQAVYGVEPGGTRSGGPITGVGSGRHGGGGGGSSSRSATRQRHSHSSSTTFRGMAMIMIRKLIWID
jgi:hypothetical protein